MRDRTLAAANPAVAKEMEISSTVDQVTVFPSGAEISRLIRLRLGAGDHTLTVGDVTGEAVPASIRIEANASGELEIGSVDSRRIRLQSDDPAIALSTRKKIEDRIEALADKRTALEGIIQTTMLQKTYLENLTRLPQTPTASATPAAQPDWGALFDVIGTKMADTTKLVTDTRIKQRQIDSQIADLQKELDAAGNTIQNRTEIKIYVRAPEAIDAVFSLRYQVHSASWTPLYDARLKTGEMEKETRPSLTLTRRASVLQNTGEDWDNVTLLLSTTRPGAATAAPDLKMIAVDFSAQQRFRASGKKQVLDGISNADQVAPQAYKNLEENQYIAQPRQVRAKEKPASPAITTFQTVYAIPGRTAIKSTGEAKRLQIMTEDIEPALMIQTVPRLDQTAYLSARLTLPATSSPLLQGQISLFRDGVFVGNGHLPQLAPGEEYDLGFGADERVKVKRIVTEDKRGETGTFTTSYVQDRRFVIAVKNLHQKAIQVQVIDRIPVPMHQDIEVTFSVDKGPQPTEKHLNDKRGVVMWRIGIEPGKDTQIGFGYKVTAPRDRPILYGEVGEEQEDLVEILNKARLKL